MTDLDLTVRLKADNTGLVGEVRVSREEIDRLGREIGQSGQQARTAATGVDRYAREVDHAGRQARELTDRNRRLAQGYGQLRAAIAAVGITVLAREYVQAADTATLLRSRLRLVTESEEELSQVERALFQAAQDTRSGYEGTVELYTRVARASGQLGASQQQLLTFTTAVNQAIQVSGASSAEAGAGVIQLSQGLASGVLRGEELNSVLEQTPRLAQAIADGMGISIGELRRMGAEGELTAERVFGALLDQADAIESEFSQLDRTVGNALTQLRNDLLLTTSAADDAGGAAEVLIEAIDDMREIVRDPEFQAGLAAIASFLANGIGFAVRNADAIGVVAGAYGTAKVATVAWTAAQLALNLALRANPIGLLLTGVGLLAAGIYALTTGGEESAEMIAEWDQAISDVRRPLGDLNDLTEEAARAVAEDAKQRLVDTEAILAQKEALDLLRRSQALELLPAPVRMRVLQLAEQGQSADQILSGPDSPFGPDVPYTNQTETAVADVVAIAQQMRADRLAMDAARREVMGAIDPFLGSGDSGGGGGGGIIQTDTDADKRLEKLRQAREEMEFELSLLSRNAREQAVLNALRSAGADATLEAWQSVENHVAGLDAEEQAVAASAAALYDRQRVIELATEAEERHADAVADIRDRLVELLPPHRQAIQAAQAWRAGALAALDETAEGYDAFAAEVETIYEDMLADAYEEDLANRRDWAAGVERTLREAADAAGDDARQFAELTEGAMARAEDAYVNFAKTGKLSLSDLGAFIEDWVLRYSFQRGIEPGLQAGADFLAAGGSAFFSSLFGGSSAGTTPGGGPGATGGPVSIKHGGGLVGAGGPMRTVPHALFASAPRFHTGGTVLHPGEVPIIAKAGETVLTAEQLGNMSGIVSALSAIAAREGGAGANGGEITLRILDAQGNRVDAQQTRKPGGGLDIAVQLDQMVGGFINRRGSATRSALEGLGAGAPLRKV